MSQEKFDPRVPLLLLLSAATGLVDAASVLGLGKVFTANMTGNVVFLGFATAGQPGFVWPLFVAALGSFLVGAAAGGRMARVHQGHSERRWLVSASVGEAVLLWIAAALALGWVYDGSPSPRVFTIIALTGVAMGFRNATIRQLKVADLTTTVLTLTLTGLAADSRIVGGTSPNRARRVGAIAAMFVGALVGALLLRTLGLAAPLALAGLLGLAGTVICAVHPRSGRVVGG
jgi:uncharacterized membrane protein YoaK (UPF0700 family)